MEQFIIENLSDVRILIILISYPYVLDQLRLENFYKTLFMIFTIIIGMILPLLFIPGILMFNLDITGTNDRSFIGAVVLYFIIIVIYLVIR